MEESRPIRVLASPGRRNRERNPFNFLWSEALAAQGCEVIDVDPSNAWSSADIFHIHWPQQAARGRFVRAFGKCFTLISRILVQRLRGTRIVWTVHNIQGHDQNHPVLEHALMRVVVRLIHGIIFLTASSRPPACAEIPALAAKPFAVIPHGLYGQRSEKTRDEARVALDLPRGVRVISFLGDIKQYKGLDELLDLFDQVPPEGVTLFIAGEAPDRKYGADIRTRISALAAKGRSIVFHEARLDDVALVDAIRAADVVALPYRASWSSGLALLVAENNGRVLAKDAPVFRELKSEVGPDQVHLYDGALTQETVAAALEAPRASAGRTSFLTARSWPEIGVQTVAFYRRLGAGRTGPSRQPLSPATGRAEPD